MLKHGILGLLNYGDSTGYEICEAFQSSLHFFWPAQTSQVYRELDALEKSGWIIRRTVEQCGKPNKKVCSITDDGREELLRWLNDPSMNAVMRVPVLMKTFFMGELPAASSLSYFKQLNEESRIGMEALQQTDASIEMYQGMIQDKRSALFWQMTADFGKRFAQMYFEWTEHCIHLLENEEEEQ